MGAELVIFLISLNLVVGLSLMGIKMLLIFYSQKQL